MRAMIGPHEGRELELMLAGTKPAATFVCDTDDLLHETRETFSPYVAAGILLERMHEVKTPAGLYTRLIYVRHGDDEHADRLVELHRPLETGEPWRRETDAEIGRLLGYPEAAIEAFLVWTNRPRR